MRSTVESVGKPLILPPGAFLFRDGDRCEQFVLVGEGSVRVFKTGETGREITLYHVQAGEICLMNTLCVFLGHTDAGHCARRGSPGSAGLSEARLPRMVDDECRDPEFHLRDDGSPFVRRDDARRGDRLRQDGPPPGSPALPAFRQQRPAAQTISTTHEELAGELGTAREVVSRLLKELEHLRVLETARGRILLRDEDALRRLQQLAEGTGH
jgi:CRP/FNR family transcriptional regulator